MYGWLQFVLNRVGRGESVAVESTATFATITAPVAEPGSPHPLEAQLPLARKPQNGRPRLCGIWSWSGGPWVQAAYVLADVICVCLIAVAVFSLRFLPGVPLGVVPPASEAGWHSIVAEYLAFLLLYAALVVLCCQSQDLYRTVRTRTALDESLAVFKAITIATLLLTAFIYLSGIKSVSRLVVSSTGPLTVGMLVAWRLWKRQVIERRAEQGIGVRNVLIVGAGKIGQTLARYLDQNRNLGYVVKGFVDNNHNGEPRLIGKVDDLPKLAQAHFVDEVFITIPSERELVKQVALEARKNRLNVKVVPELYDGLAWNAPLEFVGEIPVRVLHREELLVLGLLVKRTMDVVLSAVTLAVFAPLFVMLGVLIKLDSWGPVFYLAPRVGRKGRTFTCYKFRTMVSDADAIKAKLRQNNERNGPFFKMSNDPRVTWFGRLLRKYSLDEMPQFWNVLKGDMSLVGPRPHPLDDYQEYNLEHLQRLNVKPGITGLWQVTARQDPSFETNLELDLEYIETWSLWLDIKLLLRTLPVAARGTGV